MVTTPSGQKRDVRPEDNKDGTVTIRYQPDEVGLHKLDVSYNDKPIEGSPFEFYVSPSSSGNVHAYGPGALPDVITNNNIRSCRTPALIVMLLYAFYTY